MSDKLKELGKPGRPKADLDKCFADLQPYLQMGYSFFKSCLYANVAYSTYIIYYNSDEEFRNKLERERAKPNLQARKNIIAALMEGDTKISLEWLQAMEKEEFSRLEMTKDISERDEGIILLREIIAHRRLKKAEAKQLPEPENDDG